MLIETRAVVVVHFSSLKEILGGSMRLPYPVTLFILIACAVPQATSAQEPPQGCYSSLELRACSYECPTLTYIATPVLYGYSYVWVQYNCCGTQIYLPYTNQGSCSTAELRRPEIQKSLLERAQKTEVLVASCDGYMRQLPHVVIREKPVAPRPLWIDDQRISLPDLNPTSGERPK